MDDLSFIDALQKQHSQQVGWMPTKTLEGKIARGEVIVAEIRDRGAKGQRDEGKCEEPMGSSPLPLCPSAPLSLIGYCIGTDRYFKREDVGIIYQINVMPGKQRGFIGAALLKAMFDRAAYGCRLFCCWCAQDIEANNFWEAMGFVPLAFRAGSEKKSRVHIFWQKRVRAGDVTTPYWFPSQTDGGSLREARLVLPIPPGTHWSDAKPMILPRETPALPPKPRAAKKPAPKRNAVSRNGMWFDIPAPTQNVAITVREKPKREKRKNDPKLIAAARELRDRWLEQVQEDTSLILPSPKYDVSRALPAPCRNPTNLPALPVAA